METIEIKRCLLPNSLGKIANVSLHHFSDACDSGYGQVSYLRVENADGDVRCSFLMGKSRVAPIKSVTIPRLELTAATVSAKVASLLKKELDIKVDEEFFWTDSKIVLGYIMNEKKRFHTFVNNRVQVIKEKTRVKQWRYVSTKENPADDASRGLSIAHFMKNKQWFTGPQFLYKSRDEWLKPSIEFSIADDDSEVKGRQLLVNQVEVKDCKNTVITELAQRISNWSKMKQVISIVLSWRYKNKSINIEDVLRSEYCIFKAVQKECFSKEISVISNVSSSTSRVLEKSSPLFKLNPIIDDKGILRVGGRLKKALLDERTKYPIILPRHHDVTNMVIRWCHNAVEHGGRGTTLNMVRNKGLWVVNANSVVRSIISKCVRCRQLRGKIGEQKMADLPTDRLEPAPPFTYCAVDMFGPFTIKEGRKELKRYGALFTCMASRAIHLESTNSMDADSFIQALRRFLARRGEVRSIRSDNGTNFIGAENELTKALKEMDEEKVRNFLQDKGTDWIKWTHNPPAASHMGGVWERQIRTARAILSSLLKTHGSSLNDECFRTLLVEVEGVVNSRPLTVDTLSDANSDLPLTPNHLLTMKSKVIMPPPGVFQKEDVYYRRRWRRVQHIVNEFWTRWRKEYLISLQTRSKWQNHQRNFQKDDVVLIKDANQHRNEWKMARITDVKEDEVGDVRSVTLKTAEQTIERPIHKVVLLLGSDEYASV